MFNDDNGSLDFLDLLVIISMGIQMQSFIESRDQPSRSDLSRKLDHIIHLLETSEHHCEENNDNADKRP